MADKILKKVKDVIIFYGLTPDIYMEIIEEEKVPYSYPSAKLEDLEAILNAHLFRIKYNLEEDLNDVDKNEDSPSPSLPKRTRSYRHGKISNYKYFHL